ncbi:MAG: type II toxin-antitoxin system RelE/ParE family toxin [Proteobacteria bacterium]|jgi:toxin ParE1/3/4|nr:type II toxin-antitoxin system RelE/ParE family toxin [Pseudomonadota bacterium]
MTSLVLTRQARADLDEIWLYVAQDSLEAADRLVDTIFEKCGLIADSPQIGRERPEIAARVRSFPVRSYLIFYHEKDGSVFVDRVLSGYRDLLAAFDE